MSDLASVLPTREQRSLADQASVVLATLLTRRYCLHVRKGRCHCRGKNRMRSWVALDALIHAGWTLVPPGQKAE